MNKYLDQASPGEVWLAFHAIEASTAAAHRAGGNTARARRWAAEARKSWANYLKHRDKQRRVY